MDRNVSFPLTTGRRTLGFRDERAVREAVFGSKDFVQRMKLEKTLDVHRGCVNTICWNERGTLMLSGSDDKKLCITDPFSKQLLTSIPSGHRSNIFSAKFVPSSQDRQVVSCSGDGVIIYSNVDNQETYGQNTFNCHYGTCYEVVTLPSDPHTFMSCGEDGTVRWFDLRKKTNCAKEECKEDVMINCRRAVTALSVNPVLPYQLAVGCSDSSVRIFDRRMLGTRLSGNHVGRGMQGILCRFCPSHLQNKYSRPTSLTYSGNGNDLLVSYASDYIYLFGTNARYKHDHNSESLSDRDAGGGESGGDKDELNPGHPVKRLRLRGDWSDTGPRARPRSEIPEEERPRPTMIQRMSEMLSRWLEDSSQRPRPTPSSAASSASSPQQPTPASQQGATGGATSSSGSKLTRSKSSIEERSATSVQDRIKALNRTASDAGAGPSKTEPGKKPKSAKDSSDAAAKGGEKDERREEGITSAMKEDTEKDTDRRRKDSTEKMDVDTEAESAEWESVGRGDVDMKDDAAVKVEGERSSSCQSSKDNDPTAGDVADSTLKTNTESSGGAAKDEAIEMESERHTPDETENDGKGRKEEEKKGIFALGDRMQDRNPLPRVTKQDSLESSRTRRKSVVEAPTGLTEPRDRKDDPTKTQTSPDGEDREKKDEEPTKASQGGDKKVTEEGGASGGDGGAVEGGSRGAGAEEGGQESGESIKGATSAPTTPSSTTTTTTTQSSSRRSQSESSQSMTCSESDSEEEVQVLGPERERRTPTVRDPPEPSQPTRPRSEAERRWRQLFKTKKEERESEAEMAKNVFSPPVEMVYRGHRNSRTMIKEANFWGDHYIVSGSDCGHIFFWDRYTAELVMLLEGDKHVVNCIQPHPFDPILATSGIDYNVKLWSPLAEEPSLPENAFEVMRINELMLEETRDTITVPPSFMLRMLASLNHIRGDRRRAQDPQSTSESSDD